MTMTAVRSGCSEGKKKVTTTTQHVKGKRREILGPTVIPVSEDVRIRRSGSSNLYYVEVFDYGCGWYRYGTVLEVEFEAMSRARYVAGL